VTVHDLLSEGFFIPVRINIHPYVVLPALWQGSGFVDDEARFMHKIGFGPAMPKQGSHSLSSLSLLLPFTIFV